MTCSFVDSAYDLILCAQDSQWSIFLVIIIYVGMSFFATPQFVLHAATIVVFGSKLGFAYAFAATILGALIHFYIGKRFGREILLRYGHINIQKVSVILARHGILASALVRIIPSGPFIVVNVVAGTSHISLWHFFLGTVIGTVPKIAALAVVGGSVLQLISQYQIESLILALLVVIAFAILLTSRLGLFARQRG